MCSNASPKRKLDQSSELSAKRSRLPTLHEQLDSKLECLKREFLCSGGRYLFQLDQLDEARKALLITGVAGFGDVTDAAGVAQAALACGKGAADLHRGRVPANTIECWRRDPTKIDNPLYRRGAANHIVYGNVGFGFLFGQKTDRLLKTPVGGELVPFEYQPMHRHNIEWLEQHPTVAGAILAVGQHQGLPAPMVSWDSAKYVFDPFCGTKKILTKHHADIYSRTTPTKRVQMALEFSVKECSGGRARRLVYVPFTHHPDVQDLMSRILKKPNVFKSAGFVALDQDEALCGVLERHAVAFDSYHLAAWGDSVVHFEAFTVPDEQSPGLARVADRTLKRGPKLQLVRMVCGTHHPTVGQLELRKLAVMSEAGFLPSVYRLGVYKRTKVAQNMMCAKSTQFHKPRIVSDQEASEFADAAGLDVDATTAAWSPLKRALYGLEP